MQSGSSERYPRGSFPPYLTLGQAFELVEKIYEHAGGTASLDILSRITDNSTSSSSFIKKVNALKSYGLVTEENKTISLSDIGLALAAPKSSEAQALAKKQALLLLPVFSRIFEKHKGKLLPADEFIKNIVEQECKISRDISDRWVSAFKEALKAANLLHARGDGKYQIMESPQLGPAPPAGNGYKQATETQVQEETPRKEENPRPTIISGHSTRIALSGERYAVFSIPDMLTEKDRQKIKSALTGLQSIIDSMVIDSETQ